MSNLIRTHRIRAGLTGAQLGERLGITKAAVSQLERSEQAGTIQLGSLQRALDAVGQTLTLDTERSDPYLDHSPERTTGAMNRALRDGQPEYALRMMTHAAQTIRRHPSRFSADSFNRRPSEITDHRWEQLFRAFMGEAVFDASGSHPEWARPERLGRAWVPFGETERLRHKAKTGAPDFLRRLNILIDAKSLSRA